MRFKPNWQIHPTSRIALVKFAPARWFLLLARNAWVFANLHRPRNAFERMIDREYATAAKLALAYIKNAEVAGAVGEFGCHGRLAETIARWLAAFDPARPYHMFDSFAGYPQIVSEIDRTAPHIRSGTWGTGHSRAPVSPAALRARISRLHPPAQVHAGFFADTLPATSASMKDGLALMVMDCNLYQSHRDVLVHVFSHRLLNAGGMIMFADFNVNRASPDHSARRAWHEAVETFNVRYSDEGAYNWGGRKFIIHGYDGAPVTASDARP